MKRMSVWLLVVALCAVMPLARRGSAQGTDSGAVHITTTSTGVRISWNGSVGRSSGEPTLMGWERVADPSPSSPAQLVAVQLPPGVAPEPRITRLSSQPWDGTLSTAAPSRTPGAAPAGRRMEQPTQPTSLPTSPISVLRDGFRRGTRVVVVAVHPVFREDGKLRAATSVEAFLPGATLFDPAQPTATTPFTPRATTPALNKDAAGTAWVIQVENAGMQQLDAATLARAGLNPATINTAHLHLRWRGVEVPMEERRSANGTLQGLLFYAPEPGDRWNRSDTYWLTVQGSPANVSCSAQCCPLMPHLDRLQSRTAVGKASSSTIQRCRGRITITGLVLNCGPTRPLHL